MTHTLLQVAEPQEEWEAGVLLAQLKVQLRSGGLGGAQQPGDGILRVEMGIDSSAGC